MNKMKTAILIIAAVFLAGCAPGTVNVSPALSANSEKYAEFMMGQAKGRYASQLKSEISQLLARDFTPADGGFTVNLETLSANEGNRFARWFGGPLASTDAEGKIVVRAEFLNSEGESIGTATATGKIIVGAFGGSFDSAISSAAKEIHSVAVQRFKR